MVGTIVNTVSIIIGASIGLIAKGRISKSINDTIMNGFALCVVYISISGALKGNDIMVIIISIALGGLIGEIIDIDKKLGSFGNKIEKS